MWIARNNIKEFIFILNPWSESLVLVLTKQGGREGEKEGERESWGEDGRRGGDRGEGRKGHVLSPVKTQKSFSFSCKRCFIRKKKLNF